MPYEGTTRVPSAPPASLAARVIGFTGTREGMTEAQRTTVFELLRQARTLHHGDCVGADADADRIARQQKMQVVSHPPSDERLRAFCTADETRSAKPYLARNRDIVNESELLLATPSQDAEQQRGGTWFTVRYARSVGKPTVIVWPDGSYSLERGGQR